jgi:hypothetical protein
VCENVWLRIEGTTTNLWKHQHPKRTYCRNSTCVGKSPRKL